MLILSTNGLASSSSFEVPLNALERLNQIVYDVDIYGDDAEDGDIVEPVLRQLLFRGRGLEVAYGWNGEAHLIHLRDLQNHHEHVINFGMFPQSESQLKLLQILTECFRHGNELIVDAGRLEGLELPHFFLVVRFAPGALPMLFVFDEAGGIEQVSGLPECEYSVVSVGRLAENSDRYVVINYRDNIRAFLWQNEHLTPLLFPDCELALSPREYVQRRIVVAQRLYNIPGTAMFWVLEEGGVFRMFIDNALIGELSHEQFAQISHAILDVGVVKSEHERTYYVLVRNPERPDGVRIFLVTMTSHHKRMVTRSDLFGEIADWGHDEVLTDVSLDMEGRLRMVSSIPLNLSPRGPRSIRNLFVRLSGGPTVQVVTRYLPDEPPKPPSKPKKKFQFGFSKKEKKN